MPAENFSLVYFDNEKSLIWFKIALNSIVVVVVEEDVRMISCHE